MKRDWDDHYASGNTPWETHEAAPELVALHKAGRLPRGRALDIGCGTGNTARFLAGVGYEVVGIDVARQAIATARAVPSPAGAAIEFRHLDFLAGELPKGAFDLVFDRGCFHVFDAAADQRRFAERVAACLGADGLWVSLLGSTEGPARDHGPPRRSAREITAAVESSLRIVELREMDFDLGPLGSVMAWLLLARRRSVPAQPSTA